MIWTLSWKQQEGNKHFKKQNPVFRNWRTKLLSQLFLYVLKPPCYFWKWPCFSCKWSNDCMKNHLTWKSNLFTHSYILGDFFLKFQTMFFIRTSKRKRKCIPIDLTHQYVFLNTHNSYFVKNELILQINFKKCVQQHLLFLAYKLLSWPFRDTEYGRMRKEEQGSIIKGEKDTRNQEGRDSKGNVQKKSKADLFGVLISALLLKCFTSVLRSSRWIITKFIALSFHSDTAWIWFQIVPGFIHSLLVTLWAWSLHRKMVTWQRLWPAFPSIVVRWKIVLDTNWCRGEGALRIWHV